MQMYEDIVRVFNMTELPISEKILLLKTKGASSPEYFHLARYLVHQLLEQHKALIIADNKSVFKTRRIGEWRKTPITIRTLKKTKNSSFFYLMTFKLRGACLL